MSFAILRHGKVHSSTKGAAVAHNHRTSDVEKINIDPAQKHLNRAFMGEGAKARIDALLPKKYRKDAVVSVEVLLTASPEFFNGIEKDREKLSKNPVFLAWVDESLKWAEAEFGENVVDLVLHMDESSPHIHVLTVPLIDGRLCAKEVMARKEMTRRQTEYATAMKSFGLVRGEPAVETKRRHIGLKEVPGAGSGGQASQVAAQQLAAKQAELDKVQARFQRLNTLSMNDMAVISDLKKKVETMEKTTGEQLERIVELGKEVAGANEKWSSKDYALTEALNEVAIQAVKTRKLAEKLQLEEGKVVKLTAENTKLAAENAEMKALADLWKAKTTHRDGELAKGTPDFLIDTTPINTKLTPETPKTLLDRIEEWVKTLVQKLGNKQVQLVDGGVYSGKVLDVMPGGGAWVQKTNRDGSWVVHQGRAPGLDTHAEVRFKGGKSEIKGMDNDFQQQKSNVAR
jgi:Plasmid recombination enzyme